MALFGFGKKNASSRHGDTPEARDETEHDGIADAPQGGRSAVRREASPASIIDDNPSPHHEAVSTEVGPYDGDTVNIDDFDFADFAMGILDLGSMKIPVPKESQIQVEMGGEGPKMLHIVTRFGRLTPVAFAAPRSAGQWDEAAKDIAASMASDGLAVTVERGTWGNEIVGTSDNAVIRVIGVDGPRWMLRTTVASPVDTAAQIASLARQTIACTFVYRGDQPVLAGNGLPVVLPQELTEQIQAASNPPQLNDRNRFHQAVAESAAGAHTGSTPVDSVPPVPAGETEGSAPEGQSL